MDQHSMTAVLPEQRQFPKYDDGCHLVCHCTDDKISACGLDVEDDPWAVDDDEPACVMCCLAWPDGAPTCPFGCSCYECQG